MAKRGGKRDNAGRKPNPAKDVHLGQKQAEKLLAELEKRKGLVEIYGTCGDSRIQAMINLRIREYVWGKPAENVELSSKVSGTVKIITTAVLPDP